MGTPMPFPDLEVPIEARIVSVADAFEAMTADRPYRKAMAVDVAYGRLEESSGTQFDPELVGPFKAALIACGEMTKSSARSMAEPTSGWGPVVEPAAQPVTMGVPLPAVMSAVRPVRARRVHSITRIPATKSCHSLPMNGRTGGNGL